MSRVPAIAAAAANGVVAQELVETGVDVAGADRLEDRGAPLRWQLAAGRGDADEQAVGSDGSVEGRGERADERDVTTGHELGQVPTGHRRVEDGQDVVRP